MLEQSLCASICCLLMHIGIVDHGFHGLSCQRKKFMLLASLWVGVFPTISSGLRETSGQTSWGLDRGFFSFLGVLRIFIFYWKQCVFAGSVADGKCPVVV